MATPPVPDEVLAATVEAYLQNDKHQSNTADALNISRGALQGRIRMAARRGLMGTAPVLPGFAISKTSSELDADGNVVREFVQQKPEVSDPFTLPDGHSIKGVSALLDADGNVTAQWIKTRAEQTGILIEAIREAFADVTTSQPVSLPEHSSPDLMSVYPLADLHLGLMAWGEESGENYDLDIASDRFRASISRLMHMSPPSDTALLINLGDFFHANDQRNVTPRSGHQLDVDGRFRKVVTRGVELRRFQIEKALEKHGKVTVVDLPGNHDPEASVILSIAMASHFRDESRVTVDDDPSEFYFHRFGQTLLGAHHGHRMKQADLAMAMAVRRRDDWGSTAYHWIMTGHVHHETAKEVGDVRCESFQTIAAKDAHNAASYAGSGQSLVSVTLHREEGEIGRHRVNVKPVWTA